MAYLTGETSNPESECFLCAVGSGRAVIAGLEATGESGVVWRGQGVYALLNAYPYANGHVLVAPYAHEADLDGITEADAFEMMAVTRRIIRALRTVYRPEGFNLGANLGKAAGAGFGDHVHCHVVPRWDGDTNFMTTVGRSRVIPEKLEDTAARVRAALERDL